MENEDVNDLIDLNDEEQDEVTPFRSSLTNYGADYTVDSIRDRFDLKKLAIPKFQRRFVWDIKKASRFIESLILGLPVPGVFLSQKSKGPLMVIDGQQRLLSIKKFFDEKFGEPGKEEVFRLKGVQKGLEGKTYETLDEDDRNTLDNAVIHATIIKDSSQDQDTDTSIYMVFERLNTGGMILQPQEIRACVFPGDFNELLGELTNNKYWQKLYKKRNTRKKDEELFLRFFAFLYESESYKKKGLKNFLNLFMKVNKDLSKRLTREQLTEAFVETIKVIVESIGENAFRRGTSINAAVFESVMVGIARRLRKNHEISKEQIKMKYDNLMADEKYITATSTDTASVDAVKTRIELSTLYFSEV